MLTEHGFDFIRVVIQFVKAGSRHHYHQIQQEHLLIFALQIVQQFFGFRKGLFQVVRNHVRVNAVLRRLFLFLHFVGAHCRKLPLYDLYSFARLNRGDVHRYHYRQRGFAEVFQHIVHQRGRQMFQIDHSCKLVVIHKIVFLELKVIGAAQRFFRAAQELRTAYRAYLLINAAENFCNNADTLVGFQFFDVAADFLKTAPHIQFLCGELLLRQFQSSRRDCHREILLCGNAVLTLLHFIQKHFVVLVAVFVKAVAGVLQKYLT